jgi:hypothetical protein
MDWMCGSRGSALQAWSPEFKCQSQQWQKCFCKAWWCKVVIPALGRLRQEDLQFETSLGYIVKTLSQPSLASHSLKKFLLIHNFVYWIGNGGWLAWWEHFMNLGRGFEAFPFLVSVTSTAFYFLLVGLEFELRALRLRSWRSTTWAKPSVHFALLILEMRPCELFFEAGDICVSRI